MFSHNNDLGFPSHLAKESIPKPSPCCFGVSISDFIEIKMRPTRGSPSHSSPPRLSPQSSSILKKVPRPGSAQMAVCLLTRHLRIFRQCLPVPLGPIKSRTPSVSCNLTSNGMTPGKRGSKGFHIPFETLKER